MSVAASMWSNAISADSHVIEPANCYLDNIEAKYRDRAPRIERGPRGGDFYVIDGKMITVPVAKMAAAGLDLTAYAFDTMTLAEVGTSGSDPRNRVADQKRDGSPPSCSTRPPACLVCGVADADYKQACMWAYNRWLAEYVAFAPDRLFGLGQTAVRSVSEAIEDFREISEMGFKGVMLPCEPATEEHYDDPSFDPLWRAAVELKLPVSFHLATGRAGPPARGAAANSQHDIIRANQDVIGTFIWGGVFERHPELKIVCVEADASWAPHMAGRMDYIYDYRKDKKFHERLSRKPSAYLLENVYFTLQNDWLALRMTEFLNPARLLWANDFPHSDGCWPHSAELLEQHASHLTPAQRAGFLRGNAAELYGLN